MNKSVIAILAAVTSLSAAHTKADVLADWTFETSQPSAGGPYAAETGTGSATGVGLGTVSSPAGNGSAHSFSANGWNVGTSYFDFQVSTIGDSNIGISYDQTSSNTGPGLFNLEYSVNGGTPVVFASSYTVLPNVSPNAWSSSVPEQSMYSLSFNLSSIAALNNATTVDFLIVDASTTSANGSTVAGTGTDRVDNVIVTGSVAPVPEPSTLALGALGAVAGLLRLRRKA